MLANVRMLENENKPVSFNKVFKPYKLKIAGLTRKDCEKVPKLYKFFRNPALQIELDRFYIPEITKEQYETLVKEFINPRFKEHNAVYETASEYYIRKIRVVAVAKELGISPSMIDLTDYTWNNEFYTHYSTMRNVDYLEEAFKENSEDYRLLSANDLYIKKELKNSALDKKTYDMLYSFCYKAIINRKVMILIKVDKCLGFLNSVAEYTNGFTENVTASMNATLRSYRDFFVELLEDSVTADYIKNTNDIEVFAKCEDTHNDYIETYRKMLLMLGKSDNMTIYYNDLKHIEDPYIWEILEDFESAEDCLSDTYLEDCSDE